MGDILKKMKTHDRTSKCPLCHSEEISFFFEDKSRTYQRCSHCKLAYVPEKYWLSNEEEKAVYDLHQNDPLDQGYRRFLSRLSTPLLKKLDTKRKGLDFGCGPGPTLPILLEEEGHQVELYDPFYQNNSSVFIKKYDFICASEVVEHLHDPNIEFTTLFRILKKGGWLGIMTKMVINEQAFSKWHYIRDLTHVCFYCTRTFEYLAQRFNAELHIVADDVILFKKI